MTIEKESIKRARQVNLIEYCRHKGLELVEEGKNSGNYRVKDRGGLIIKENKYNWFSKNSGGDVIAFCMNVYELSFKEAVDELATFQDTQEGGRRSPSPAIRRERLEREKEVFVLPKAENDNNKVFAYLTRTRKISEDLVNRLISSGLIYQDERGNCVFPCFDKNGEAKAAILRGTIPDRPFHNEAKNSDKKFGWLLKPEKDSDLVIVTESVIDALSILVLSPNLDGKVYLLAMGGVGLAPLKVFLSNHKGVKRVVVSVDNDEAGSQCFKAIQEDFGVDHEIIDRRPKNKKDWNEVLCSRRK
ncbi:DNA primase [Desulfosporosinus acididurans]|uniref:DNA primase n=1 Tax=Desulfosporosinus acididurans TaxID=476652 RepID=A0A0J1FVV6_9FIRM|nr:DUF3991 domain-containing protein [Desulfosporosinus acididurans]KLU67550.1 DNA primase [Desulfosporosinus acididurans]